MAFRLIYVAAAIIGGIIETSPVAPNIVLDGARDAQFIYDASGKLIASISPTAGSDSFGNQYVAGYGSYNNANQTYAQLVANALHLGVVNGGVPDTAEAGSLLSLNPNQGQGVIILNSGINTAAGLPNAANVSVEPGQNLGLTSQFAPFIQLSDSQGTAPVDQLMSGNVIKTGNTGVAETWLTPTAATGWTIGSLQYRITPLDQLTWVGSCTYTGANVTAAGASTINVNVGPSHRPKAQWKVAISHLTSTSVQKNIGTSAIFNTDGTVVIQWGDGMAGTTHDVNGLATGDVFWIEATIPFGNIL